MPRRAYPKRVKEGDERIVVSFSLSADTLKYFREAYSLAEGHDPAVEEIREKARNLTFQGITDYIKRHIEIDGAIIL